jgi:hypothetical protein
MRHKRENTQQNANLYFFLAIKENKFTFSHKLNAAIAQLVEQRIRNA